MFSVLETLILRDFFSQGTRRDWLVVVGGTWLKAFKLDIPKLESLWKETLIHRVPVENYHSYKLSTLI